MKSNVFISLFLSVLIFSSVLTAQTGLSPDELAIHQVIKDMENGWNTKDGQQFAAHFAEDHSYIVWNGMYMAHMNPAGNAQAHQGIFDSIYKEMYIGLKVDNVRFVQPDVAMVHTFITNRYGKEPAPDYPQLIATMLMVKKGANWEIVSFHNLNIEYDQLLRNPEPTAEEKLAYAKENYPSWYR